MAVHHPTPPLRGGERPRLPSARGTKVSLTASAQVGPVTQAIRAMRAAEGFSASSEKLAQLAPVSPYGTAQFTHGIRALSRAEVENLVEGLIDLLDAWGGDTDHEPDLDREPEALDASAAEWSGRGAHRFNVGAAA